MRFNTSEFALRGARTLGWYATNELGYTIVQGYVSPGDKLLIVSRPERGTDRGSNVGAARGLGAIHVMAPESPDGVLQAVVDLSSDTRATIGAQRRNRSYDVESYDAEVLRLQPILDATVAGPETDGR